MMKRAAIVLAVLGLLGGFAPEARADHVLWGSTLTTTGIRYGCEGAYCTTFRLAGCPVAMASPHGVTTSIVDVSHLGGTALEFSWRDATMRLNEAGVNVNASMNFYAVSSCDYEPGDFPNHLPSALTLTTRNRTKTYTIPADTKWLIVEPSFHATGVLWSARELPDPDEEP